MPVNSFNPSINSCVSIWSSLTCCSSIKHSINIEKHSLYRLLLLFYNRRPLTHRLPPLNRAHYLKQRALSIFYLLVEYIIFKHFLININFIKCLFPCYSFFNRPIFIVTFNRLIPTIINAIDHI